MRSHKSELDVTDSGEFLSRQLLDCKGNGPDMELEEARREDQGVMMYNVQ